MPNVRCDDGLADAVARHATRVLEACLLVGRAVVHAREEVQMQVHVGHAGSLLADRRCPPVSLTLSWSLTKSIGADLRFRQACSPDLHSRSWRPTAPAARPPAERADAECAKD